MGVRPIKATMCGIIGHIIVNSTNFVVGIKGANIVNKYF